MADRSVIANLDFDSVKEDLVNHFKSREEFADYEFTGSSLNLLMDILSYNTHYYSLASNFLLNESFLDSALLRKNVVSLAKRLNYTPRSISSAFTTLTLRFTKQDADDNVVIVPAGSSFTASTGNSSVNFYTMQDHVVQFNETDPSGTTDTIDVVVYEGQYRSQSFLSDKNYTDFANFSLGQADIDTSTIRVSVNGTKYEKVETADETLFDLNSKSRVYFLEESRDGYPQLVFGNGVAGKALSAGDRIVVSYLVSSGENGNGISRFTASVSGRPDAIITATSVSQGGASRETIQSIKDNAPKWFQAQYRCVTTNDYEVILKNKYADIQAISVYGGEEVGYPGKVFICIKPKSGDALTESTKSVLKSEIIKESNVVTVRPEFVDPQIFKLALDTVVVYDKSKLSTTREMLKTKVKNLYTYINTNYIGDFLSSYRESNLSYEIKNLDSAVVSSNTRVKMSAVVTTSNLKLDRYNFRFNNRLYHPKDGFLGEEGGVFSSSFFYRVGRNYPSAFDEDGYGNIRLYDYIDDTKVYVNRKAGRLNYDTGEVNFLFDFDPLDASFTISVVTESVDVISIQDMILEIDTGASSVDAVEINETDLLKTINLSRSF